MNFTTNWRDRRTIFAPTHYSIANYSTDTKSDMINTFGDDIFKNLHLIPDPLKKNLADTLITEGKKVPKTSLEDDIVVHNEVNMAPQEMPSEHSTLSGITNFFSGVMNVISNAMFSMRKPPHHSVDDGHGMAVPSMWHGANLLDENKILQDEICSNDRASELVSEMGDVRAAVAHCQTKIEQVRLLLGSKPVPCSLRVRRRPKRAFVEAGAVEDSFEDAFSPEDFENLSDNSFIEYYSPMCNHEQVFHEIAGPKIQTKVSESPKIIPKEPTITESTEIVTAVPETVTNKGNKLDMEEKKEIVASCEDKLSKLKALLQERKKKTKTRMEPEPEIVPEQKAPVSLPPKPPKHKDHKVKDKRFKNPNRCSDKRRKSKMRKNINDDLMFAHEIPSEDLSSSLDNSPSINTLENYLPQSNTQEKEYFDEVSGCFHPSSVSENEECFQIVFNDCPKPRRQSDCDSEDSFIVFEDSPDSCYTSNDVFGDSSDSDEYDSDSDLSDSGCGTMTFNLPSSLSKSVSNLADDSLYVDHSEDEVDCAVNTVINEPVEEISSGVLLDERKKLMRKGQPPKKVQFSSEPPKVHVMRVWAFAARQARCGNWSQYSLDRDRFKRRIADVDMAVSWVLKPQHRSRVMFQRFMPWWNAQKRKELAEKKERDAQEKLKKEEEERLKLEQIEKEENLNQTEDGDMNEVITDVNTEKEITKDTDENNKKDIKEMKGEEVISNECNKFDNESFNTLKQINCQKDVAENEVNKKTTNDNDIKTTKVNEIVPLNEKIIDINQDFVAKEILNT